MLVQCVKGSRQMGLVITVKRTAIRSATLPWHEATTVVRCRAAVGRYIWGLPSPGCCQIWTELITWGLEIKRVQIKLDPGKLPRSSEGRAEASANGAHATIIYPHRSRFSHDLKLGKALEVVVPNLWRTLDKAWHLPLVLGYATHPRPWKNVARRAAAAGRRCMRDSVFHPSHITLTLIYVGQEDDADMDGNAEHRIWSARKNQRLLPAAPHTPLVELTSVLWFIAIKHQLDY